MTAEFIRAHFGEWNDPDLARNIRCETLRDAGYTLGQINKQLEYEGFEAIYE